MVKVVPFFSSDIEELSSNTYIVIDSFSSCVVIDPSRNNNKIIDYIINNGLVLKAILLTHSHFDHIRGVDKLVEYFSVPVYLHKDDLEGLTNPIINCSASYRLKNDLIVKSKPTLVDDYDVIKELNEDIVVISTPFHTIGSCCYYLSNSDIIFTGDSLFKQSIGRSDLPSSKASLEKSSLKKIMALKNEVIVYPGHGEITTIGSEKQRNPFIKI